MLVLSRKVGQKIALGDDIVLVVNRIAGNRVSIGIEAPSHVRIVRGELEFEDAAEKSAEIHRVSDERISPGSNAVLADCVGAAGIVAEPASVEAYSGGINTGP